MRKFIFHLESVLDLRRQDELNCERSLAAAQIEQQACERGLVEIEREALAAAGERTKRLAGGASGEWLLTHAQREQGLEVARSAAAQKLRECEQKVVEAQAALKIASCQRQALENLRDRQREAWLAEGRRQERLEQDEIAQQLTFRGRSAS